MGRRVEDQVRLIGVQQIVHPSPVPDGTDAHVQRQLRVLPAQLHLDVVGVVFVDVEDHQPPGLVPGDLAAQLAADGPAAAGDQHRFVVDIAADLPQVHPDGVPAQQVLQLHPAELADGDLAVDQLIDARHHLDLAPGFAAYVQNFLPPGPCRDGMAKMILRMSYRFTAWGMSRRPPTMRTPSRIRPRLAGLSSMRQATRLLR